MEDWSKERLPDSLKEKVLSNPHTVKGTKSNNSDKNYISRPEQWQVVEWLRVNHGIWIKVDHFLTNENTVDWDFEIDKVDNDLDEKSNYIPLVSFDIERSFETPQEAYSAAFDYIKENNLI